MTDFPDKKRMLDINHLFRTLLGRDADPIGLRHYYDSKYSVEKIRQTLLNSEEYSSKKIKKEISELFRPTKLNPWIFTSGEVFQSWEKELVEMYGIKGVIRLGGNDLVETSHFDTFLSVPISSTKQLDSTKGALIVDVMHRLHLEGKKTLVYSKLGIIRPTVIVALYYAITDKVSFQTKLIEVANRAAPAAKAQQIVDDTVVGAVRSLTFLR